MISLRKDVIFGCPAEIHKSALKNAQQCGDLFRKGSFLGKSVRIGEMSEGMGWDVGGPDHGTSEGILNLIPRRKRGGYKY